MEFDVSLKRRTVSPANTGSGSSRVITWCPDVDREVHQEPEQRFSMTVILSINAGSSSLKATLYAYGEEKKLRSIAKAEISNINQPPARLKYSAGGQQDKKEIREIGDHAAAFEYIWKTFLDDERVKEMKDRKSIKYACHRVVQGGEYHEDQLITQETFHKIEALEDLAPLHNAPAVSLMQACQQQLPETVNVACFDSAFHHTMPEAVKTYMIDQTIAKKKGLRKYGFHGLSYSYITKACAEYLGKPRDQLNVIALHLGSGASMCAIKDGKSLDTTMGLTPVSGLPGSSRSGDIDPALIFHYTSDAAKLSPSSTKELHISTAEEILNKKSGWKALTGTGDFAEIAVSNAAAEKKLALDIFVDRIVGYVGSYYVKLGGQVDALVFAGGIGEKSALLRRMIVDRVSCLGFAIDDARNNNIEDNPVFVIGEWDNKRTLVCQTDEDFEMAYNTMLNPK